jgi:hypothetical protein
MSMRIGTKAPIGNIDGFYVRTPGGRIGWVEEVWLDDEGETTAVAVRLPNTQRGLVFRDDIDEILPEELTIAVRSGARLLELEPPHLNPGADGTFTASWTASGKALAVPELTPTASVVRPAASSEPSFFRTVTVLYAGLFVIGCALTGLCFLIPYLAAGKPY